MGRPVREDGHRKRIDLRCDAFLTMERKLPTAAEFVRREAAISILRPTDFWDQLRPWAALYRKRMDRVAHPLGGGVSRGRRTPGLAPLVPIRRPSASSG
jgi:hypothetical protein